MNAAHSAALRAEHAPRVAPGGAGGPASSPAEARGGSGAARRVRRGARRGACVAAKAQCGAGAVPLDRHRRERAATRRAGDAAAPHAAPARAKAGAPHATPRISAPRRRRPPDAPRRAAALSRDAAAAAARAGPGAQRRVRCHVTDATSGSREFVPMPVFEQTCSPSGPAAAAAMASPAPGSLLKRQAAASPRATPKSAPRGDNKENGTGADPTPTSVRAPRRRRRCCCARAARGADGCAPRRRSRRRF